MPDNNTPVSLIDQFNLQQEFGGYETPIFPNASPNTPFRDLDSSSSNFDPSGAGSVGGSTKNPVSALDAYENAIRAKTQEQRGKFDGGGIPRTIATAFSDRYAQYLPGDYDNEDAAGQGQSFLSKAASGILKGGLLAGTTFAQSTFGLLNGLVAWASTGRAASFYDNEFNRNLDEFNKQMEDSLPNYYTNQEKNAAWYSPTKLLTGNFLWDGIVKNLGFAAGAALSGGVFASALKALPLTARLFSIGKAAETLAASEEGLLASGRAASVYGKVKELSDQFLGNYKTLSAGGRAVVNGLATTGEAGFEAYQNLNSFRDQKIQEFKNGYIDENGVRHGGTGEDPVGEDLQKINTLSDSVGNSSFLLNTALLSFTNYIQFPKILGSNYKGEKNLLNSLVQKTEEIVQKEGKFLTPPSSLPKVLQGINKVRPYLFSASEGFEEGAQYAIQVGTQDYYSKKNNNIDNTALQSLVEGVTKTLTTNEGMENVLIGGLSGAIMQGRGKFLENKKLQENTQQAVSSLNKYNLSDFTKETLDSINRGTTLQEEREKALQQGDVLNSKDLETDYIINYLTPRIKYGRFDLVKSDIEQYRQLASTAEGFAQLQAEGKALATDTPQAYLNRINGLETMANNVLSLSQSLNLRYGSQVDENKKPIYTPDVINKMIYSASKIADYDVRIPLVNTNLISHSIDTLNILQSIRENDRPSREAIDEALKQINSLDTIQETKDDLKSELRDVIELSLRRKQFIEEYNEIKRNPLNYQEREIDDEPTTIEIDQKQKVEGKRNRQIKKIELQVGKEYSLKEAIYKNNNELHLSPKITILSSTLGGEYEVRMPNGKVQFLTPTEFKEYNISPSEDNTDEALVKALDNSIDTILKSEKFSTINIPDTVQNKLAYINSLDNKELVDAIQREFNKNTKTLLENREKERIAREKLAMEKEALDKQQTSLELTSADVETIPITSEDFVGSEDKRKDVDILFLSTTSTSEETDDKPHSKRARTFLNNFKFFTNKDKVKTILVTPNNAKELGLEGIVQMSYGKELTDSLSEEETNIDLGFMAQVVILQLPEGDYFSDDKGNKLSKVGEESPTILDNVVFQTMTSASLYTTGGFEKVRKGQEEQAELALEAYKLFRKEVFSQKGYTPYSFSISRGVPKQNKIDGKKEDNPVKWILGTDAENIISTHAGLISVVTTGKVENNGELLSFPVGTTLIQYGDLLDYVNNKRLTSKQSQSIFSVIEALSKDLIEKSNNDQPLKIDFNYSKFLQNVLFWKSKGDTSSPSQIGIDTTKMEFKIGEQSFSLFSISDNKDTIIEALQKAFINVNNITLSEGVSKKFTEYTVDKDGNLSTVIWKNYQTYLLSDKNPDGSKRSTEDIPLITHTAASTDTSPSYKQKYMFITDRDVLPYTKVPAKGVKKQTTTPSSSVGEYTLDGTTQNTFTLNTGPIQFTATINDGVVNVDVQTNDTINKLSTEQALTTAVDNNLASLPEELITIDLSKATNEEKALLFVKLRIESELGKQLETPAPLVKEEKVQPMAPPKVVARHDLEAKKADIERRRQEELNQSKVILPIGTSGSGKSTFIKTLPQENLVVISPDEMRVEFTGDINDKSKDKEIYEEAAKRAVDAIKQGKQVVFDTTNLTKDKRLPFIEAIKKALPNANIQYKLMELNPELAKQRIKAQIERGEDRANVPDATIDRHAESYKQMLKDIKNEPLTEFKTDKEINAKYDAELAKLEEPTEKPNLFNSNFKLGQRNNAPEYRVIGNESGEQMTNSDLEIFKQWHQKNVPFIPFEILERIIRTQYNTEAWGVFENGVAKFVKGGLRGTEYHEIFEAIWADFLSEQEKQALLQEFKSKKGEFTDRASGITYQYSDPYLSDNLIKERIADDFADFRLGKITRKTLGDKIADFFQSILNFFKAFVARPSLKDSLFKAIDSGRFKGTKLSNGSRTSPPQYRAIEGLTEEQTNDFVQDMVSQVKLIIFGEGRKDLLFNPEKMTGEEVFSKVKDIYQSLGALDALGEERYNSLVKKSIEFLRTIGISFNQDEVVSINNEESNNRDYAPEAFSTDWKQHSTGAIKFLLSTLTERKPLNQSNTQPGQQLNISDVKKSNIDGYKLLNFNKVFVTLFDRLHNTTDPKIFAKKLVQLAKEDANYLPVFRALGGNLVTHSFDFDNFGDSDWRLFIQFFNTFTRQKPEALIQYISEEGDVYTSNANVFSIINQTVDSWVANMKVLGKAHGNLISYDKKEKVYKINKEAIKKTPIKKPKEMIDFLSSIGVDFPIGSYDALSDREAIIKGKLTSEMKLFTNAVASIYTQLGNNNDLMTFDTKRLQINGPLRVLSALYTKVNNPNQESTYFGVEGQRIGSFSENNAPSYFENTFNESETLEELLNAMPQLNDVYSRGSEILRKGGLFFNEQGKRIAEIKVEYIQGTKNEVTGKDKSTSKLTLGERTVQEINQNINGKYYVLIPGDSSTEWMMNLGNVISMDEVQANTHWNKVYKIYNNYLNDEINLALDNRKQNLYTREHSQELRILRDVLPQHIVQEIEGMIKGDYPLEEIQEFVITKNKKEINDSIKEFIENISKETIKNLINSNEISSAGENEYVLNNFDSQFLKDYKLQGKISYDDILNTINFVNINYTINNQEYHKVLFGDPYQFKTSKGKLDETKRIKSFLSPRRRTFDTPEYNNFLNKKFNTINGVQLTEGTPGYNNNKSYTNTVTFNDVDIVGSIATIKEIAQEIKNPFSKTNETDAMSWLMDYTHKEIALKEGQWSEQAEAFHQWNMAYTRRAFDTKNISKYTNEALREHDNNLLSSPMPKHKLAVRKPIISGNKNGKTEIDLLLDKTSQMGLYFHMVEGKALEKMYIQMFKQNIGYGIVVSGRKVGTEELHSLYNEDGTFNTSEYTNIIEVPWKIYGTQVETMSEGEKTQTRGSQPTKIATSDLFENGEPIGATPERKEVIRKAVERHDDALDMLNENGYNELLNKLGITDLGDEYVLEDNQKISETLMYEMMRRQLSENAKDTIQLDEETKEFLIPFEASPSYTQIKNILYSMVNKALVSPSMSGAPHVQVPVTMFEKATKGRSLAIKTEEGWIKITKNQYDSLTEEEKKKVLLTDSTLKFYTPDAPYCEIMLPAWFKNKLKKGKFKTDEDLLNYLNSTKEGQKILSGIGFRIPTQALSSMEVFRVKGFLPDYMGYTVVVPSEITTKAGSDFDIDKLNMYLKSIYIDSKGDIKLVSYKGSEQATKDFYSDVYEQTIQKEIDKIQQYDEFREQLFSLFHVLEDVSLPLTKEQQRFYDVHEFMINNIVEQADESDMLPSEYILDQIKLLGNKENKLNSNLLNTVLKDKFVQDNYRKSLENEYYDSIEELLTLPENFSKLITPVSDGGLEAISELLDTTRGYNESDIKARLINRNYMTNLRHAFITGKRWVGIAAVNITNLSLRQKSRVYLDPNKIALLSAQERNFIEDVNIILPHNIINVNGNNYPSLSGTKTADGSQLISERLSGYATAFVDIANKPFITKIIKSDIIVSTFMFLESVGAGNMGIYFLNQPIIEKYLEYLDSVNSKSVTNRNHLKYIRNLFPTTQKAIENTQISTDQLLDNIQEYYANSKFDALKNAEQQLILNEFLKYKILADQLFSYTQATNYDTTRFGGSDTLLKKEWATFNVNNFNLISNVTDILTKTFIGRQAELLSKSFASFGVIFKTEIPEIKAYTLSTLKKYATRKYMSTDDYEKIANLIKNSFIDYIIQNNTSIKNMIEPLLLNSETSVVTQLEQAKQKYPSIQLLQDLIPDLGNRENSAKSIQLKANVKDAYSENMYVGMMRELRDTNEELKALYNNIINVAILQGTTQSAISIRNIIPVEDYAKRIAPIIRQLSPNTSLEQFAEGMFERNNFTNKDLFIKFTPHTKELDNAVFDSNTGEETIGYYMPGFKTMKGVTRESRKLIALNGKYNAFELASDYIKVPKVITTKTGAKVNIKTGLQVTSSDYAKMKKQGSFSLYDAYYYKKVYTSNVDQYNNPIPLQIRNSKTASFEYIYKLINVYGDGNRATEMNTLLTPSQIDNGSIKIQEELTDAEIVSHFSPQIQEESLPLPTIEEPSSMNNTMLRMQPDNIKKIKDGSKTITNRTELFKDGIYSLSDGTKVELKLLGKTKMELADKTDPESQMFEIGTPLEEDWSRDDIAKGEGFKDWDDFVKNNKFSSNFINGSQSRYIYSIKIISEDNSWKEEDNDDSCVPF